MRESRRMKRMERNNRKVIMQALNLIPMLDVLSVLVFFLLFHSFNGDHAGTADRSASFRCRDQAEGNSGDLGHPRSGNGSGGSRDEDL